MPDAVDEAAAHSISILVWLSKKPGVIVVEVAQHFHRTAAQIRRDIELLDSVYDSRPGESPEFDWELYRDPDRLSVFNNLGVNLLPSLTQEEVAALLVGLQEIVALLDEDQQGCIAAHIAIPVASLAGTRENFPSFIFLSPTDDGVALSDVREAVEKGVSIKFIYTSESGTRMRYVDPDHLERGASGWLLSGWDRGDHSNRCYRVNSMRDVILLEELSIHENNRKELREDTTIRIRVDPRAMWVTDSLPATIISHDDNSIEIELPCGVGIGLRAYSLIFQRIFLALSPPATQ